MLFLNVSGYINTGRGTVSGRSCLRGLDFGVGVKMGNLFGRRSGDIEHSLEARDVCGERVTGFRDEARGGLFAVWYILASVVFGGVLTLAGSGALD